MYTIHFEYEYIILSKNAKNVFLSPNKIWSFELLFSTQHLTGREIQMVEKRPMRPLYTGRSVLKLMNDERAY